MTVPEMMRAMLGSVNSACRSELGFPPKTGMMSEQQFREKFKVRTCTKCCANCLYGRDLCDDGMYNCVHPELEEPILNYGEDVCNGWMSRKIDREEK